MKAVDTIRVFTKTNRDRMFNPLSGSCRLKPSSHISLTFGHYIDKRAFVLRGREVMRYKLYGLKSSYTFKFIAGMLLACFLSISYPQIAGAGQVEAICTILVTDDSEVNKNNPAAINGAKSSATIRSATNVSQDGVFRIYAKTGDLATSACLEDGQLLPQNPEIVSAEFRMFSTNSPLNYIEVIQRVDEAGVWDENTLTWDNQPSVLTTNQTENQTSGKSLFLTRWDITDDIKLFLTGTVNNGWRISSKTETYDLLVSNTSAYATKEHNKVLTEPHISPRIKITYLEETNTPVSNIAVPVPNTSYDFFQTSKCSNGYTPYQLPYGKNILLVGDNVENLNSDRISTALLVLDNFDEVMANVFGWQFTAADAFDHHIALHGNRVCEDITSVGAGSKGLGMTPSRFGGTTGKSGMLSTYDFIKSIMHERIHQWDSTRGKFIFHASPSHSMTSAFESILPKYIGAGYFENNRLPPAVNRYHYYDRGMKRYLSDPSITWENYFSSDNLAKYAAVESGTPWYEESLSIQGAILDWIEQVYGLSGLHAVLNELDEDRKNAGLGASIEAPTTAEANDNLLRYISDGLGIDGRDYFIFWKFPISSEMNTYLDNANYPSGIGVLDNDGDGFTALEGDFNDNDNSIYPEADELKDGKDNNLDGLIDETYVKEINLTGNDLSSVPSNQSLSIPLKLDGEVVALDDLDAFQFILDEKKSLTFSFRATGTNSPTQFDDNGYPVDTFIGYLKLNGSSIRTSYQPNISTTRVLPAGIHSIEIEAGRASPRNAMPGMYTLHIFESFNEDVILDTGLPQGALSLPSFGGLNADPQFTCENVTDVSKAECESLVSIYTNLDGENWLDTRGWLNSNKVCDWQGVACNRDGISVLVFEDDGLDLEGNLKSEDWSGLINLKILELNTIGAGGEFPASFLNMGLEELKSKVPSNFCLPASHSGWFSGIATTTLIEDCLDSDSDGVYDMSDSCITSDGNLNADVDTDGCDDADEDLDDDNDGVDDMNDDFPLNAGESVDTDNDGIGNNADLDDDNDAFSDEVEIEEGTDPLNQMSFPVDAGTGTGSGTVTGTGTGTGNSGSSGGGVGAIGSSYINLLSILIFILFIRQASLRKHFIAAMR